MVVAVTRAVAARVDQVDRPGRARSLRESLDRDRDRDRQVKHRVEARRVAEAVLVVKGNIFK